MLISAELMQSRQPVAMEFEDMGVELHSASWWDVATDRPGTLEPVPCLVSRFRLSGACAWIYSLVPVHVLDNAEKEGRNRREFRAVEDLAAMQGYGITLREKPLESIYTYMGKQ